MKKVLGLLLSVLMTANIIFLPVSAEDYSDKAEKVMCGLGAFADDYEPDKEITRAEFAKVLCDLLHFADPDYDSNIWKENTMNSNDGETSVKKSVFTDVDASHPYYNEILLVVQRGVMNGIGGEMFAPEYGITANEVSKVILDLMGYNVFAANSGGYPAGYSALAYSLGMMNGVKAKPTSTVTEKDLINMLYNSFDIKLVEMSIGSDLTYSKTDDTFMTGILKLGRIRGYVTDNGFTALHGKTELSAGEMKIGENIFHSKEESEDLTDYLGHRTEIYYTENDDDKYIEYAEIIDGDDTITFDICDFDSYSNNTVTFYDGEKKISKRVSADAEMIVNNEWKQTYTAADFNFADGNVTLIPNENGIYGTIIVNSYAFAAVSGKDTNNEIIYNKITNNASEKQYDFSGNDVPEKSIFITNADGKKIDFESITTGSILNIIKSNTYMNVIVSGTTVSDFKVSSITDDEHEKRIGNGETEYTLAGAFETVKNSDALENNHAYTLYLNKFGKVIWIEGLSSSDLHIAVLTRAEYFENEKENNSRCISLYTDEGKLKNYATDKKVFINGQKYKFEDAVTTLNQHKGEAVRYSLDDQGRIAEIILASKLSTEDYSNWYQIADTSASYTYGGQAGDFSNQFYTSSSTLKFSVPNDESYFEDEDYFSLNSIDFIDNKSNYKLSAFVSDKDNVIAEAIVIRQDAVVSAGTIKEGQAFIIKDIIKTVNDDNDEVLRLSGYSVGITTGAPKLNEYDIGENCKMIAFGGTAAEVDQTKSEEEVGPRTFKELSAGDIIYYETNAKDEIVSIRIAFDYSTGKGFDGGRGIDHYDPTKTGTAVNTTWVGKALSIYGTGIRLAIDCEPKDVDYTNAANFRKQTSSYIIRKTDSIFIVEKGRRNKVNIQNGTIGDIKTYGNTGDSCDNVVVLTYWSSGTYATVAYRN